MKKFKLGDRVVSLKESLDGKCKAGDVGIVHSHVFTTYEKEQIRVIVKGNIIPGRWASEYEFEAAYNSPLMKALEEK